MVLAAFLIAAIYLVQVVSAASIVEDLNSFIDGSIEFFNPISAKILGDTTSGQDLFAKLLFFIIVLSLVWMALYQIPFFSPANGTGLWVIWTISIAVSILAIRFISDSQWIQTIILPYSTLGIVLAAGFPFAIYFILIDLGLKGPGYKTIRKVAWVFFAVVFIGLFVSRSEQVGSARNIYFATAGLAFIVALMDGTVQMMLHRMHMDRILGESKENESDVIQAKLVWYNKQYAKGAISMRRYQTATDELRKRLNKLQK